MSAIKMDISHSQLSVIVTDIKFPCTNEVLSPCPWIGRCTSLWCWLSFCPLRAIVVLRPLGDYWHLRSLCLLTRTYFTNLDNPIWSAWLHLRLANGSDSGSTFPKQQGIGIPTTADRSAKRLFPHFYSRF